MLKSNIPGGIVVVLIVLGIIAYAFSIRLSLDWNLYFSILGIVAVVALFISLITHFIPSKDRN